MLILKGLTKINFMRIGILLFFSFIAFNISAQRSCGTDQLHEHMLATDQDYAKNAKIKAIQRIRASVSNKSLSCSGTITIPVAVHFNDPVTCEDSECLLEAVEAQIAVLNEDYSASNDDYQRYLDHNAACPSSYPLSTAPVQGEGACIEFCLASENHPESSELCDGDPAITIGLYDWFTKAPGWDGYLNIFVDGSFNNLGLSPLGGDADGDGFWVNPNAFGGPGVSCFSGTDINGSNTYGLGRTCSHEAGHYLNLPHVFAGCGGGDGIPDTNPQNQPIYGDPQIDDCNDVITQCGDEPANFYSFMDYTDDAGMIMFTQDQSDVQNDYASGLDWNTNVCGVPYGSINCGACNNEPLAIFLDDSFDPACAAECNGSITVFAEGGDGDYTFTIDGNSPNSDGVFENLCGGDYTLLVQDGDGETDEIDVEIFEPDAIVLEILQTIDPACFDQATGSIELDISGGTDDYTIFVNGANFGDDFLIEDLEAGVYDIVVEDENDCEASTTVSIDQPEELLGDVIEQIDPSCYGNEDGQISLEVTGGIGEYLYSFDGVNFQSSPIFEGLPSGEFDFIIEDENNCSILITAFLDEPEPIEISVTEIMDELDCFGDANGFVSIEASNTSGPYTYSLDGINFTNSGEFNDLGAGPLTIYVLDGNDCTSMIELEILQPEALIVEAILDNPISCNGANDGEVFINANGGSNNYQYFLGDLSNPVTETVDDLGPGVYDFIVIDENDCQEIVQIALTEPEEIEINTIEIIQVACFGDETGAASFEASGGVSPYTFEIDGISNTDGQFNNMTSGTYFLNVTDNNDCTETLMFDIDQTSSLLLDVTVIANNLCSDDTNGAFSLQGMGGDGVYLYSLDGINFSEQNSFEDLPAGVYDVFVQDGSNCITISSAVIEAPESLTLESNEINSISCFGDENGTILIEANGGAGDYIFNLGQSSNDTGLFTDLTAGSFLFEVIDGNGCSSEIEYTLNQPQEIVLDNSSAINNSCEGMTEGQISMAASGGTGELTYSLLGNTNTTGLFENLAAGSYEISITDANNCSIIEIINIENEVDLQLSLVESISPTCNDTQDGSIVVSASGSAGILTYQLGNEINETGAFFNLTAGSFSVSVTNADGCTTSIMVDVTATPLIDISEAVINDVQCFGESNGSISIDADGGSGDLTFEINGQVNTDGNFDNLTAGDFELLVTDANGCQSSSFFTIEEPEAFSLELIENNIIECAGDNTGIIEVTAMGGSGSFNYSLNNGPLNDTGVFDDLTAGTYSISVFDEATGQNCQEEIMVTVEESDAIQTEIAQIVHVDCFGDPSGLIELSAAGGDGNLSYFLDGQESQIGAFFNLSSGVYVVEVRDGLGCTQDFQFEIETPDDLVFEIEELSLATTDEGGAIKVFPQGGVMPYDIILNDGTQADANNEFKDLVPGTYIVMVRDANGCLTQMDIEIRQEDSGPGLPEGFTFEEVLYPNPAREMITLDFLSSSDQLIELEFYNDIGQYIGKESFSVPAGPNSHTMDISEFPAATYILKLVSEKNFRHFKFIKVR